MLTLIYRRDPLGFTLVCIAAYVLAMGLGNGLSERLGAAYSGNALLAALFIAALLGWSGKGGLRRTLGLCRPRVPARRALWYAPLAAIDACNLLGGLGRVSWPETAIAAAAMLCAGVLEEILFRGLLLGALMPRGPRRAVWLSALAFGLVHALNLLGGAGAGETAAQIVCACAVGVMLALLTLRCGSILPGAAMHGALNVLSALTVPADAGRNLLTAVLMTALAAGYALFLRPRGDKNGIRG